MEKNQNPQILHHAALQIIEPAMRYQGKEPFATWQERARAQLIERIGLDRIEAAREDRFTTSETDEGDFIDHAFTFQSEDGYFVPCHLWVPKGKEGKQPMVICLQGHSKGYHISLGRPLYPGDEASIAGGDRDFAVRLLREGYGALAIEQRCFGACGGNEKGPDCTLPSMTALLYGRTTIGERVFDIRRALDMIEAHFPQIDMTRIACMGNSGGGTATIYASALDERIALCMPSCALCTFQDSIGAMFHCPCNYIPGIALDFDMGDLCGLIAPRPMVVVSGKVDPIFPHDGVAASVALAKTYYAAAGAPDSLSWVEGEGGHRFYADAAYPFFHQQFDGQ